MATPSQSTKCPVLLMDGGLGTTLVDSFSCTFNNSTPLWSSDLLISDPTTLLRAQSSFATAGADIILTATYQASNKGFALTSRTRSPTDTEPAQPGAGYDASDAAEYMRKAVRIARDAFNLAGKDAKENGKIALSLGPYGAAMHPVSAEYTGAYDAAGSTVEGLIDWHRERLQVFLRDDILRKISYIAFETLPRIEEVTAVREVMRDVDVPFWISCVFPGEGNELPDGKSVKDFVKAASEGDAPRPMGIGMNCTKIWKIRGLVSEFEDALKESWEGQWPALVTYPDGAQGLVYNTQKHDWEVLEGAEKVNWDETMWEIVKEVRERGGWKSILVGGCCKTTAEDIGNLRKRIDEGL